MTSAEPVLSGLDRVRAWQEELYRQLHQHPELSHQEHETAATVASRLEQAGYSVTRGVDGTGVVGILRNGSGPTVLLRADSAAPCRQCCSVPTVLLRADMDALSVREATGLPYARTMTATDRHSDRHGDEVPVMHACGHDLHVTCLLGAAQLLADGTEAWHGIGRRAVPARRGGRGRRTGHGRRRPGAADPDPGRRPGPTRPARARRRLDTNPGPTLSAADSLRITVHGRGGDGSMPQPTVDPVLLAATIVVRLP